MKIRPVLVRLCLLLALARGCTPYHGPDPILDASPGQVMVRTELFFGMSRPDGSADIDEEQWQQFVRDEVTSRFPSGLTVLDARGQWRESDGDVQREASRVLVIVHPGDRESGRKIEEVRVIYKDRFAQEAVLRADSIEKVSF